MKHNRLSLEELADRVNFARMMSITLWGTDLDAITAADQQCANLTGKTWAEYVTVRQQEMGL